MRATLTRISIAGMSRAVDLVSLVSRLRRRFVIVLRETARPFLALEEEIRLIGRIPEFP
jgi:hypothetical protein